MAIGLFDECVVAELKGNSKVLVKAGSYAFQNDYRMSDNVINLTALGLRSRQEVSENE